MHLTGAHARIPVHTSGGFKTWRPAIHPGEFLLEEYLNRWTPHDGSGSLNRLNEIVLGKRGITANTALRLARFQHGRRSSGCGCRQIGIFTRRCSGRGGGYGRRCTCFVPDDLQAEFLENHSPAGCVEPSRDRRLLSRIARPLSTPSGPRERHGEKRCGAADGLRPFRPSAPHRVREPFTRPWHPKNDFTISSTTCSTETNCCNWRYCSIEGLQSSSFFRPAFRRRTSSVR